MEDIDLREFIDDRFSSVSSVNSLKALLRDYFPENRREINILCDLYECGLCRELSIKGELGEAETIQYANRMENTYGVKRVYTFWGIKTWMDGFGIENDIDNLIEKELQSIHDETNKPATRRSNLRDVGELLVDTVEMEIEYKGIEIQDFHYGSHDIVTFVFEMRNLTDLPIEVSLHDVTINKGYIIIPKTVIVDPQDTIICKEFQESAYGRRVTARSIDEIKTVKMKVRYDIEDRCYEKTVRLVPRESEI